MTYKDLLSKIAFKILNITKNTNEESLIRDNFYESIIAGLIKNMPRRTSTPIASLWPQSSSFYDVANSHMMRAEIEFSEHLISDLCARQVPGDIVEFGVFQGDWIEHLYVSLEKNESQKKIYGFDSFEGLPRPDAANDLDCWVEGQYSADYKSVYDKLKCEIRPRLILVPGWFNISVKSQLAINIETICYCRIDCDLYESAKSALEFLTDRLANNAIIIFDDWTHDENKGETKAFIEWAPRSRLQFEFLAHNSIGHLYLRVRR